MDTIKAPFTVQEYKKMFTESPVMHSPRVKLLKFHFSRPGHVTTARAMAEGVGYANFTAANLQYGAFARDLVESMNWSSKMPEEAVAIFALAVLLRPDEEHPEWEWELHPEAVEALKQIGW